MDPRKTSDQLVEAKGIQIMNEWWKFSECMLHNVRKLQTNMIVYM